MSLGEGVFAASVVLSITALFIATKDRWSWKKIILWPLAVILVLGLGFWGWITVSSFKSTRPTVHNTYWGVQLGDRQEDVLFKKGAPDKKGEGYWWYGSDNSEYRYQVVFGDDGAVDLIAYWGTTYMAEELDGRGRYDSLETLKETFGEPTGVATSQEGARRTFCFNDYHVFFSLTENKVDGYGIYQPAQTKLGCAKFEKE